MGGKLYTERDEWRSVEEEPAPGEYRTPYRRDYARLVHAPAFRRLQGKTQLFPGIESDFFRNRLTHSLEVAQVAKSIALRLNATCPELASDPINTDIVEFAGLAHDMGHPPFGHNGEKALDACMKEHGGFEGNAQTFRILARLERKRFAKGHPATAADTGVSPDGTDYRCGINATARSLAAVLKYDQMIPASRGSKADLVKGYYESERLIVEKVKSLVGNRAADGCCSGAADGFKTLECQIMDLADDIAYSTYDLEDAFKAGFLTPLAVLSLDGSLLAKVAEKVVEKTGDASVDAIRVREDLAQLFKASWVKVEDDEEHLTSTVMTYQRSSDTASLGHLRTNLTSQIHGGRRFIEEWGPAVATFASNAYDRIVSIWKDIGPTVDSVSASIKSFLTDDGSIDKIIKVLELYGTLKVGGAVTPLFSAMAGLGGAEGGVAGMGAAGGAAAGILGAAGTIALTVGAVTIAAQVVDLLAGTSGKEHNMFEGDGFWSKVGNTFIRKSQSAIDEEQGRAAYLDRLAKTVGEMDMASAEYQRRITGLIDTGDTLAAEFVSMAAAASHASSVLGSLSGPSGPGGMTPGEFSADVSSYIGLMNVSGMAAAMAAQAEKKLTPKTKGGGGGGSMRVEITINSNQAPGQIARSVVERLQQLRRHPNTSTRSPNFTTPRS